MEQTPDKRAHLVTTLFESLADSPELLGDVKDSMVATVLKKLRANAKELKQENVLRKHENQHTWDTATQTFDSVIDNVVKNTTDIEDLKRKVEMLYGNGARHANCRRRGPTHSHCVLPRVAQSVTSPSISLRSMATATVSSARLRWTRPPRRPRRTSRCATTERPCERRPHLRLRVAFNPDPKPCPHHRRHTPPPSRVCGLCR